MPRGGAHVIGKVRRTRAQRKLFAAPVSARVAGIRTGRSIDTVESGCDRRRVDASALEGLLAQRLDLGARNTPLEPLDRLRSALGCAPRLWIKRDDVMSRALGGNKLRKLEFLLWEAQRAGATAIGTIGGPTSNHLRITASAALQLGMKPYAYVAGNADIAQGGNLRLLQLLGATICELGSGRSALEMANEARDDFAARCGKEGLRGHFITYGGASLAGDLGYVLGARELATQLSALGRKPTALYVAVGTGGTAVGLAVGAALYLPETDVVGYAVTAKGAQVFAGLGSVGAQLGRLVAAVRAAMPAALPATGATLPEPRFRMDHGQLGAGYAEATDAATEAIELLARTEGIFVDPVYTGKALAGLIAEVRAGRYAESDDVIFVHTGGLPGLFFTRR